MSDSIIEAVTTECEAFVDGVEGLTKLLPERPLTAAFVAEHQEVDDVLWIFEGADITDAQRFRLQNLEDKYRAVTDLLEERGISE